MISSAILCCIRISWQQVSAFATSGRLVRCRSAETSREPRAMSRDDQGRVHRHIDATFADSVARLQELLRFPSVGVDPRHEGDTKACAQWLADQLGGVGMDASVRPTAACRWSWRTIVPPRPTPPICSITATTMSSPPTRWSCGERRRSSPDLSTGRTGRVWSPRRGRRQGPADDLRRGDARLEGRAWRACRCA